MADFPDAFGDDEFGDVVVELGIFQHAVLDVEFNVFLCLRRLLFAALILGFSPRRAIETIFYAGFCEAFGGRYLIEVFAAGEAAEAEVSVGVLDDDLFERGAFLEGFSADFSDTVGDDDALQRGAAAEGILADFRDALGDDDALQRGAVLEGIFSDFGDTVGNGIIAGNNDRRSINQGTVCHYQMLEVYASEEGFIADFSDTVRDDDALQRGAVPEGISADNFYAVRDDNLCNGVIDFDGLQLAFDYKFGFSHK